MKVEVVVLAPVPNKPTVCVDVKQHSANYTYVVTTQTENICGLTLKRHNCNCVRTSVIMST